MSSSYLLPVSKVFTDIYKGNTEVRKEKKKEGGKAAHARWLSARKLNLLFSSSDSSVRR